MESVPLGFVSLAIVSAIFLVCLHYFTSLVKTFLTMGLVISLTFYFLLADSSQKKQMDDFAKEKLSILKNIKLPSEEEIKKKLNFLQ